MNTKHLYFKNLVIIIALALSAGSALIYEIVATHILFFYYIESSYSVSAVLSVFMFGLGIGSYFIYKLLPKIKNKEKFFGLLQLCIGIYAIIIISQLDQILLKISDWSVIGSSVLILLLPTIFLGASFPMAVTLFKKKKNDITGLAYSADLFGAVAGSICSGFILIPQIGNSLTALVGASLNLISAIIIFLKIKSKWLAFFSIIIILFCWILVIYFPNLTINGVGGQKSKQSNHVFINTYYANSPYGPVRVTNNTLYVNNKDMCSLNYPEDTSEKMMVEYALNPLNITNAKVLNIGLGCGLTLEKLLNNTTQTIDIVEINPKVVEANKTMTNVLSNERVNLIIDDGLRYLRNTDIKYDSILIDVEDPTVAHSSGLYTVEAFESISKALNQNGTLSFWKYFDKQSEYNDILYFSLKETFTYVYDYQKVFVASMQHFDAIEYQPITPYKINTLDKNTLTDAFLNNL